MKLGEGEVVSTVSGRLTTPFPPVRLETTRSTTATVQRVASWLLHNAMDEAAARGHTFAHRQFAQAMRRPTQADKDSAECFLFAGNA